MKASSHAYKLIHQLSMSEKRYFKIFSERHTIGTQNKYVVLFDILDRMKEEEDETIRKKLKEQNINPSFLSADRNYLYHLILKSLNDFHDSKSMNLEIKELLLSIEILFHKGLYPECLKLIQRAAKLAMDAENFSLMIDILNWKKKCEGYSKGLAEATRINQEIDKYLKLLNEHKQITNLYYKSYHIYLNAEGVFTENHRKQIQKITSQPIIRDENQIHTFLGKVYYLIIMANYHLIHGDYKKEAVIMERLVNMLNQSTSYKLENPLDYISIYNRYIGILKHGSKERFYAAIEELKLFSEEKHINKEIIRQRIFIHCTTHELEYLLKNAQTLSGIQRMSVLDKEVNRFDYPIEKYHFIYFYYLQAALYLAADQPRKALKPINHVMNNFEIQDRPQVFIRLMILNITAHFENEHHDLVLQLVKQILQLDKKWKLLLPTEIALIHAFKTLSGYVDHTARQRKEEFGKVIQKIKEESQHKKSDLLENYRTWVTRKMNQ